MNTTIPGIASLTTLIWAWGCSNGVSQSGADSKMNVLFITVDDMRDYVGYLDGYEGKVYTPNIDRLASRGVAFTNAHTAATVSCPSRNAMLTGMRPSTTGLYDNSQWWKAAHPELISLPQYFKNNGYLTAGAGKVFHHTPGNNPPCSWDDFQPQIFDDPWVTSEWPVEKYWLNYGYREPRVSFPEWKPLHGISELGPEMDWGPIPGKEEKDYGDVQIVNYARSFLSQKHDKPFFLALGTYKPHIPWHVPQKYFDLYPLDSIVIPEKQENDLDDVPSIGRKLALANKDYTTIKDADQLKQAIRAYLACISFADAQLGAILDILDKSGYADNTIIVFWSDHGWHFGTKEHWHKQTLWEECTRIPFIIEVPGLTNKKSTCDRPVDMINVYPTLLSLCSLPSNPSLDGHDMTPLLTDPNSDWPFPAVTEIKAGNAAVRSQDWRYIRYNDGSEELYNRKEDPHEWDNLASDPEYSKIIEEHRKWIPSSFAKPAPSKDNYYYDPGSYTFMNRQTGEFIDGKK